MTDDATRAARAANLARATSESSGTSVASATNAIETRRLTKFYGQKPVVCGLDLQVPRGCVYGLLGRNGAGKSTTIKMLTGMVPRDDGQIELLGHSLERMTPDVRARVAYVAEGHPLMSDMTVQQMADFTQSFYPRWNHRLVERMLDHFRLARRQRIRRLSNGQRAQVSLTLALGPDPELLVLDDPTLGLDTVVRRDFLETMIHVIQREGRTILLSSHILSDVERVADRIGILVDGVLRADCPLDTFRDSIRRVTLRFHGSPPDVRSLPGLVAQQTRGPYLDLVIANYADLHRDLIESWEPAQMELSELSLEDAFIEYTRGNDSRSQVWLGDINDASVDQKGAA
jgi:ABC-2 type transport system ATP-binding protein